MFATQPRKTLLVVEDDAAARQGMAVLLAREGYEVALAANGREALDYLDTHPLPDLILLDMLMPYLDGWGFLDELKRKDSPTVSVPVIVITGSNVTSEWALQHGCVGCVRKPIEVDHLLAEIRRNLA